MLRYYTKADGKKAAELLPDSEVIESPGDMLDLMVEAGYNDCDKLIIHSQNLPKDFFDLKTGIAGEILQKFSNYRMKLSVIGDYKEIKSKSLNDFIFESNKQRQVTFVDSIDKALKL